MGIAFPCKGFLSLGWCFLFVVSGLTAQVSGAKPSGSQNDPPPQIEAPRANDHDEPRIELYPDLLNLHSLKAPHVEEQEKEQKAMHEAVGWIRWILLGILAALASWRTSQAIWKQPGLATDTPKTRMEELGLGVDGKDGVWRREVSPWEK